MVTTSRPGGSFRLGPTGWKDGDRPGDRGSLYVAFGIVARARQAFMDFGTILKWVSLPLDGAREMAQRFRDQITVEFGKLDYDVSTLPIGVRLDGDQVVIELPRPTQILVANPEVFLALADRIDAVMATPASPP